MESEAECFSSGIEDFAQAFLAIGEYFFHIATDKQPIDERAAARAIADAVETKRAAVAFREDVSVMPQLVGSADLDIDELMRRIPFEDFGAPADGQSMHANAIVDERTGMHGDGGGRQDFELQPWRRDGFEVSRFGKKRKYPAARAGQP